MASMRFLCIFFGATISQFLPAQATSLPVVDLGYERHQALSFNESVGLYKFSSIRYAQPPIGDLRFRAPVPPDGKSDIVNNGSVAAQCPQAQGSWHLIAKQSVPLCLAGTPFDYDSAASNVPEDPPSSVYEGGNEDCLFLDVIVPKDAFDKGGNSSAPVLVWIHGGGYTSGNKTGGSGATFDPTGLLETSNNSMIYVAINYRLGAFGFLAGSEVEVDGTTNAGLYDQRLALEWVQQNIHLFGGDRNRVTVMGQSAGGGSLLHQISAFGGENSSSLPFSQAIVQSPAFNPDPLPSTSEQALQKFLRLLNVSTLTEARQSPSDSLMKANALQVWNSPYGSNTFAPVVDGGFVPDVPRKLLAEGRFHKNINVMVAHNSDESLTFTTPQIDSSATYAEFLQEAFPNLSNETFSHISSVLYPPVFDGSYGYKSQFQRGVSTIAESAFICNTDYLNWGFDNETFAYEFSIPPGTHGLDTPYLFMTGPNDSIENTTVARALQEYVVSFVMNATPSGSDVPVIPRYGANHQIVDMSNTGIAVTDDDIIASRCAWWQQATLS